jgi:hypothetical protein
LRTVVVNIQRPACRVARVTASSFTFGKSRSAR